MTLCSITLCQALDKLFLFTAKRIHPNDSLLVTNDKGLQLPNSQQLSSRGQVMAESK